MFLAVAASSKGIEAALADTRVGAGRFLALQNLWLKRMQQSLERADGTCWWSLGLRDRLM